FFYIEQSSSDIGVIEVRRVKLRRLFSLIIEPQKWRNFLHFVLFLCGRRRILLKFRNHWIHFVPRLRIRNEEIPLRLKPAWIIEGASQDSHHRRFPSLEFAANHST